MLHIKVGLLHINTKVEEGHGPMMSSNYILIYRNLKLYLELRKILLGQIFLIVSKKKLSDNTVDTPCVKKHTKLIERAVKIIKPLGEMGMKSETTAILKNLLSFLLWATMIPFMKPFKLELSS